MRPVWAEINLDNLAHNIKEVRRITKKDTLITAVVKANAYGHGAVETSKVFLENGGDRLAVANLSEAIELRLNGIDAPILILGYTSKAEYTQVLKYNIIPTIYDYEYAKALSKEATKLGVVAKIHIKIDTGMGRIGFLSKDETISEIISISKLPNIEIEGIFTHFANVDEADKDYTRLQYDRFIKIVKDLEGRGVYIPIKHVSNSAAIIDLPEYNLNMVRAGIMLYGLYPSDKVNKNNIKLKPAMTLKAKICHIKEVAENVGIGYGQIFVTKRKSKIATISIGYADGFTRLLTSKGEAFVNGKMVPIVGRICMDQCMLDVTDVKNVNIEDEVILFGDGKFGPHIDDVANKLNTINYEIVSIVGRRVPRIYVKSGKVTGIVDYLLECHNE